MWYRQLLCASIDKRDLSTEVREPYLLYQCPAAAAGSYPDTLSD